MAVSENRSGAYVQYVSTGSAGNCHLQTALANKTDDLVNANNE